MTYNPNTLRALGAFWTAQGGVNLGVVGDTAHAAKGYSYHLGADQLAANAYSAQTARDRAGLTNAASAIDLGRLGGTLPKLRAFSRWLVGRGQRNEPGTSDIREIIYTLDGKVVLRWDRERGYAAAPRAGEADDSHLTHTHISFYRDSEGRDKRSLFAPYFAPPQEEPMAVVVLAPLVPARIFRVAAGTARGFRPDSPTPVKTAQFALAKADATAVITQTPATLVPHGNFVRAWDGPLAGLYIPAGEVTLDPAPPTGDCTAAARQGWNDARQAAANAAGPAILTAVPMK